MWAGINNKKRDTNMKTILMVALVASLIWVINSEVAQDQATHLMAACTGMFLAMIRRPARD